MELWKKIGVGVLISFIYYLLSGAGDLALLFLAFIIYHNLFPK